MENTFVLWAAEKKVKESDMPFVSLIKTPSQQEIFQRLSNQIVSLRPSFSEGLSILEMVTELILMGHQEDLFSNLDTLNGYKNHVRGLRYPMATNQDDQLKTKLQNLPWPQGSKIKFERRGDRAGVEVKCFVSSTTDVKKLIAAFERVEAEMQS